MTPVEWLEDQFRRALSPLGGVDRAYWQLSRRSEYDQPFLRIKDDHPADEGQCHACKGVATAMDAHEFVRARRTIVASANVGRLGRP